MTTPSQPPIPLGKLPPDLLARLLADAPVFDDRLLLGPGVGLDCAILALENTCLVFKSEPITFATDQIGWYAVQVAGNDIATTAAQPRWMLVTLLLPEGKTTPALVESIFNQLATACREQRISLIGGHTEVTYNLDRPLLNVTLIGEVARDRLITPQGARPGDAILITKGVPIEAAAIAARELPERLANALSPSEIARAADMIYTPGISIARDAALAMAAGQVTAMHDPTEGGLATALWELAEACGHTLEVNLADVILPPLAARICAALRIDPLASISSGTLLFTAAIEDAPQITRALVTEGIPCSVIGRVKSGPPRVVTLPECQLLPRPDRDEIARLLEEG